MTKIDEKVISRLEKLARLKLRPEEKKRITQDLQSIVDMFDKLEEVDTSGVLPLQHMGKEIGLTREDVISNELEHNDAMKNVPRKKDGFIVVPKFLNPE